MGQRACDLRSNLYGQSNRYHRRRVHRRLRSIGLGSHPVAYDMLWLWRAMWFRQRQRNRTTNMTTGLNEILVSTLADDPDLGEIVRLYVGEMPQRIAALQASFELGDRVRLATLAHQMKGSAGSHGFHAITSYAATLERLSRFNASDEELRQAFEALIEICSRVR
jgi:HPt (histidine-containing phosphotransfer) domain-containing protein